MNIKQIKEMISKSRQAQKLWNEARDIYEKDNFTDEIRLCTSGSGLESLEMHVFCGLDAVHKLLNSDAVIKEEIMNYCAYTLRRSFKHDGVTFFQIYTQTDVNKLLEEKQNGARGEQ